MTDTEVCFAVHWWQAAQHVSASVAVASSSSVGSFFSSWHFCQVVSEVSMLDLQAPAGA